MILLISAAATWHVTHTDCGEEVIKKILMLLWCLHAPGLIHHDRSGYQTELSLTFPHVDISALTATCAPCL